MNRITNMTNIDAPSDSESDIGDVGDINTVGCSTGPPRLCRQTIIILSLVGIILAASLAIGIAIIAADRPGGRSTAFDGRAEDQQQLLETAGRVVTACSEHALN